MTVDERVETILRGLERAPDRRDFFARQVRRIYADARDLVLKEIAFVVDEQIKRELSLHAEKDAI